MKIKRIIIIVIIILAVIGAFVFNSILSKNRKVNKIVYQIEYQSEPLFPEKDLDKYVKDSCGILIGKLVNSVDLNKIEKKIAGYPYLKSVEVIANTRGNITIKAVQHKVIVRVFNAQNESFYISDNGYLVPLSSLPADRVLIANGEIYQHYRNTHLLETQKNNILYSIWKLASFIEKDPFLKPQIGQIYINLQKEIELVPTVGDHIIRFGRINNMEEKFENLKNIYTKGFKITGWNKYAAVNLKFGNQIPCEKRQ